MASKKSLLIDVKEKGSKKAERNIKSLSGSLGKLSKGVIASAGAYFGARGLISAVKGSIEAYGKQELAEKKLTTALGFTSKALLEQASALQQLSMFGDEDIIMMQSMFASFGQTEEQIKELTSATLDLASGMGLDLRTAGDLVAKTIGSSTNAMSRYGVEVTGAVGSTERLETLTGNIARLFGGQAKAQAETMTGAIQQSQNAMGDLGEVIGKKLEPVVTDVALGMKAIAESLGEIIDTSDDERIKQIHKDLDIMESSVKVQNHALDENTSWWKVLIMAQSGIPSALAPTQGAVDNTTEKMEELRNELDKLMGTPSPFNPDTKDSPLVLAPEIVEDIEEATESVLNFSSAIQKGLGDAFDPKKGAGEGFKSFMLDVMSAMQGVLMGSKAVSTALTTMWSPVGIGTAIMGLIALEGAKSVLKNLKFAEHGMNEIVTEPTMIIAGEKGAESVNITPLGSGGGEGGGGINLHFHSPVTNVDFVRDFIIPEIKNAKSLGLA